MLPRRSHRRKITIILIGLSIIIGTFFTRERFDLNIFYPSLVYLGNIFDGIHMLRHIYPSSILFFNIKLEMRFNIVIWRN